MRKLLTHLSIAVLLVTTFQLQGQTAEDSFKQGNASYADGRYQEAIDAYRKVLDSDLESAAVYYNLANAHFKLNNIAPSVYYYEKAKRLAPGDFEIRNNASFAEKMKIDAIQPLPENTFKRWFNSVLNLTTTDGWAYITVGLMILFVVLFLGYYFSIDSVKKRSLFVGSFTSILLGGVALLFAYTAYDKAEKDRPAIVFATEADVKSEPNLASTEAFKLHEGTRVMILDTVDNWKKIIIADGKTGWIPATDIREL